jgi:hypothetical protein
LLTVLASAAVALPVAPSFAQADEGSHRIVTPTRLQVLFFGMESDWMKAVQKKDSKALDGLLSDEFQVWRAAPPGDPIPREDWQREVFGKKLDSFAIRQITARSLSPEIAVASFVLDETSGKNQRSYFVVDVWNHADGSWKCSDRYLSPMTETPGRKAPARKKPSGRG